MQLNNKNITNRSDKLPKGNEGVGVSSFMETYNNTTEYRQSLKDIIPLGTRVSFNKTVANRFVGVQGTVTGHRDSITMSARVNDVTFDTPKEGIKRLGVLKRHVDIIQDVIK